MIMEFEFKDIKYDYGKFKVKTNKLYTKQELDTFLNDRYTKEETYNKNELNSLITTPNVQYVSVTATEQTTDVTDVLPATGTANTIYRIGNWDGSQYLTTVYSEYAWNGSAYIPLNVKEYGIDNLPTSGSENLVKSGGVIRNLSDDFIGGMTMVDNGTLYPYVITADGKFGTSTSSRHTAIPVNAGEVYYLISDSDACRYAFATSAEYSSGGNIPLVSGTSVVEMPVANNYYKIVIPSGCTYLLYRAGGTQTYITTKCYKHYDGIDEIYGCIRHEVVSESLFGFVIASNIRSGEHIYIKVKFGASAAVRIDNTGNADATVILFNRTVTPGYETIIDYTAITDIDNLYMWSSAITSGGYVDFTVYRKITASIEKDLLQVSQSLDETEQQVNTINVELDGFTNNIDKEVVANTSFSQKIIESPHNGTTYEVTIQTNNASFSILAVTKGNQSTSSSSRIYWKAASANSTIKIIYKCDEDNAEDVYIWGTTSVVLTSGTLNINIAVKGIVDRVAALGESLIIVDADGSGDYTSLQEAMNNAGDSANHPKTILVFPGKYEMPRGTGNIRAEGNRHLSIIGTDKNNCIVYNNGGYYPNRQNDDACIRISGNVYIANLTIISKSTNFPEGASESDKKAYCVHIDHAAPENSVCEINNGLRVNDRYSCIGIGLKTNFTVKVENCELDFTLASAFESGGAIFCHDGDGAIGVQKLMLKNNIIRCTKSVSTQIVKSSLLSKPYNGVITAEFIQNVCTNNASYPSNTALSSLSFGNNQDNMNYS